MTKEKRTRASEPVRNVPTRSKINSRWDENEPQNWSVSELILRLKNMASMTHRTDFYNYHKVFP